MPQTTNQNDTWHVPVYVAKGLKRVSTGTKCREGNTWSHQLIDKVVPVKTHYTLWHATMCWGQGYSETCVRQHCMSLPKPAHRLLCRIEMKDWQQLHTTYVHYMDTYFVEPFNNVLNIFLISASANLGIRTMPCGLIWRSCIGTKMWRVPAYRTVFEDSYGHKKMWRVILLSVWRPFWNSRTFSYELNCDISISEVFFCICEFLTIMITIIRIICV